MGGRKQYINRNNGGKRSIRDSRLGEVIGFLFCLVLFLSCLGVMVGGVRFLIRHDPDKFAPGEVVVSREMDYHFGKGQHGTLTMATLRGEPVLIVGRAERDGWLLPEISPEKFRELALGDPDAKVPVLEHYDMHPYISYGVRFVVCGVGLVVTGLGCLGCVSEWLGW